MNTSHILTLLSLTGLAATWAAPAGPRSSDLFYNPFSADSAHHRPIGTGAIYVAADNPAIVDFLTGSAFNINPGSRPWGCGVWESNPDDPLFTVTYGGQDDGGRPGEFPVQCRLPLDLVMVQQRNSGDNFDGVLVVYDRAADTIHHFRQFNWHTEKPTEAAKPTAGAHVWLRTCGGKKNDLCYAVAGDARGNIFLTGAFGATSAYGKTPPLASKGDTEIMVIKLG